MIVTETPDFKTLLQQQEILRQVIESISSELELRPLLTRIVVHACQLLGADRGTIGLVDEENNLIRTEAVHNMPDDELGAEMIEGVGLAGQVLYTRAPLVLNRYGEVEQPLQIGMVEDAVIGLPIFWRERMIGFFGIGVAPPGQFKQWHVETLTLFARHVAVAIVNAQLYAQAQKTVDETRLLYETSYHISTATTIDDVIRAYLNQVAVKGRYTCTIALYEFDESGERQAVVIQGFWSFGQEISLQKFRIPYERDALDMPLDRGETIMIADVQTDVRVPLGLREMQQREGRPALAFIPLMVRGERVGLVILSYGAVHRWNEANLRPYQTTAAQLATALDNRWQQELLLDRGRQVAALEERQRLARELHDSVTQLVFSITLIAQSIAPAWRRSMVEGEQRVNRLLELSQAALTEMRALLVELCSDEDNSPPSAVDVLPGIVRLKQQGLYAALQRYLTNIVQDGLQVHFDVRLYTRHSIETESVLYRIAQEALNNVTKHAHARQVEVVLESGENKIMMSVQDDGMGFALPTHDLTEHSTKSLGLKIMAERAQALGGTFEISAAPGSGTRIEVVIPISQGENQ